MKKEKTKKIIILIIGITIILFILYYILPYLLIVLSIIFNMFFIYPDKPIIKKHEFPFELIYEYKGQEKYIKDSIICEYKGNTYTIESGNIRNWDYTYKNNDQYGIYYIDQENNLDLSIIVPEACEYYMGDKETTVEDTTPYINYTDEETGTYYNEKESIDLVEIKIKKFNNSKPLKNNYK